MVIDLRPKNNTYNKKITLRGTGIKTHNTYININNARATQDTI